MESGNQVYLCPGPGGDGNQQKHSGNGYLAVQVYSCCHNIRPWKYISDFKRHVLDLVTLRAQWGRWVKIKRCKYTFSSCDTVKETEENLVVQGVKEGGCKELTFTPQTSGMKRNQQALGKGRSVCEGQVLGRAWQTLEARSGGVGGGQGKRKIWPDGGGSMGWEG